MAQCVEFGFVLLSSAGGIGMAVSYNRLWKLLIDKRMNKARLMEATRISSRTMAKMTNNQPVALPVLEKICAELECDIGDVMEFTGLDGVRTEY